MNTSNSSSSGVCVCALLIILLRQAPPFARSSIYKRGPSRSRPGNRLEAQSDIPVEATIHLELWRTGIREVTKPAEAHSYMGQNLEFEKIFEYPDSITSTPDQSLLWYHRNESSVVAETFKRQDMGHLAGEVTDPLIGLTSGCKLRGQNLVKNPSLA
ncbi:MAG: DUF5703 domain-containing protein [Verrucomicrobiota bacterium]|nr:DUF5703 domain-containing protein [Verrucomicrobiota bacterium]